MNNLTVQPEELIFMIGELYVEKSKMQQINIALAKKIDELKNEEAKSAHAKEGEKKDEPTTTDND